MMLVWWRVYGDDVLVWWRIVDVYDVVQPWYVL